MAPPPPSGSHCTTSCPCTTAPGPSPPRLCARLLPACRGTQQLGSSPPGAPGGGPRPERQPLMPGAAAPPAEAWPVCRPLTGPSCRASRHCVQGWQAESRFRGAASPAWHMGRHMHAQAGCWQAPGCGPHLLCLLTTLSKPSAARRSREARRPYSRGMMGV